MAEVNEVDIALEGMARRIAQLSVEVEVWRARAIASGWSQEQSEAEEAIESED